jgi:hypothetical protein
LNIFKFRKCKKKIQKSRKEKRKPINPKKPEETTESGKLGWKLLETSRNRQNKKRRNLSVVAIAKWAGPPADRFRRERIAPGWQSLFFTYSGRDRAHRTGAVLSGSTHLARTVRFPQFFLCLGGFLWVSPVFLPVSLVFQIFCQFFLKSNLYFITF